MTTRPTILVTGSAGFIGKDAVARLLARGYPVRAMMRGDGSSPFPPHDNLEVVRADVRDAAALGAVVQGAAAVIHLAAATADQKDSEEINVGGARRLVEACTAAGCDRVLNVSTQAAKIPRKGRYARTKAEADTVFDTSGLRVTTLLPSVVYGEERRGVFGTVCRYVRKLPVVPVLGNGKWVSAPVYVGDVSEALIACLENGATAGRRYDIAGPDTITFDGLIDLICAETGLRRWKFHVPFGVSLAAAKALAWLPRPPVTVSNVLGSNQNTDIDIGPARRDFGFDPLDLRTGLRAVLGKGPNPRALGPVRGP